MLTRRALQPGQRGADQAALAALHVEHEDDFLAGSQRDHGRDTEGKG